MPGIPKIEDWFDNGEEFEDCLTSAEDEAKRGKEQDFVADMRKKWDTYGLQSFLSEAQAAWLKKIAKMD